MDWNVHKKVRYGMRYIYRKKIMLLLLIAVSLISVRLLTGCGEGLNILTEDSVNSGDNNGIEPEEPDINWPDWSYRRSVTISNNGTEQTDYQINVILDGTFNYSETASDGSDIRFNYDGISLRYWIEYWNQSGNSSIWVKVPLIPSGGKVIYMYYGKPGETAASNFDNTFTKNSGFSGLVAQWHMDEGSGSSIDDSSSGSNDGTISGASWAGADGGKWFTSTTAGFSTGDSLSFDGTDDYVTVADSTSLDVTAITIALWIKAGSVSSTQYLVAKWLPTGDNRAYSLFLNGSTVVFETSFDGSTYNTLNSSTSLIASTWYHIAVTFSGTAKVIFINGSSSGNTSVTGTLRNSNANLTIATVNDGTLADFYEGIIDEVSIYNRALTADEVKALSQRRKDSADIGDSPTVGSEETVP